MDPKEKERSKFRSSTQPSAFRKLIDDITGESGKLDGDRAETIVRKAKQQVDKSVFYSGTVFEQLAEATLRELLTTSDPVVRVKVLAQVMREITDPVSYR